MKKILVYLLNGIGNILLYTPCLRQLRKNHPDAQIDALVMYKQGQLLLEGNPHVSNVIHFDFMKEGYLKSLKFCKQLRKERYDISILAYPHNQYQYNVINKVVGAKLRLGHTYHVKNMKSLSFFNHKKIPISRDDHEIDDNFRLLQLICDDVDFNDKKLEVCLTDEDKQFAEQYVEDNGLQGKFVIGIHAGSSELAGMQHKRWASHKFAQLADKLADKYNAKILLFGAPSEDNLKQEIMQNMQHKAHNVVTPTVRTAATLMSHCNLFVTNDSGLMHFATLAEIPTLTIVGMINPVKTMPPYGTIAVVYKNLHCSPCYNIGETISCKYRTFACMKDISVEEVYQQAELLLERTNTGTPK